MDYQLKDKVVIITGANAGIGKAAAIQIARTGATVVTACRNPERGARARDEVRVASGSQKVELMQVDLASQESVRRFVDEFKAGHDRLDVLIHNAANFDHAQKKPVITADGVETVFATNHLGPFLMTNLLLDLLQASAPSRVITVASQGLMTYPFLDIEFDNLNGERKFSLQHAYYHSKQAQVMFTFDLAERLKGFSVTANCICVGNVAIPDDRLAHLPGWMRKMYNLKRKFSMTPEKMAETYTWLAADPVLLDVTGAYWLGPNVPARANRNAYKKETWKKLWHVSAALTKLKD